MSTYYKLGQDHHEIGFLFDVIGLFPDVRGNIGDQYSLGKCSLNDLPQFAKMC